MKPTTMHHTPVRPQPLPKLAMVRCANRRDVRGASPLRRKKTHVRRVA